MKVCGINSVVSIQTNDGTPNVVEGTITTIKNSKRSGPYLEVKDHEYGDVLVPIDTIVGIDNVSVSS